MRPVWLWSTVSERRREGQTTITHAFEGFIIGAVLRYTTTPAKKTDMIRVNDTSMLKNVIPNWISFEWESIRRGEEKRSRTSFRDHNHTAIHLYGYQGPFQRDAIPVDNHKVSDLAFSNVPFRLSCLGDVQLGDLLQSDSPTDYLPRWLQHETSAFFGDLFSLWIRIVSICQKNFFRNLGAILMFALVGTTIACVSTGWVIV